MRLLLWGLAAAALLATEPGKRLQHKAVETFKAMKGKAFGDEAQEGEKQEKQEKQDGKSSNEEKSSKKDGKPSKDEGDSDHDSERKNGKRALKAVPNAKSDEESNGDKEDLETSSEALKGSEERRPEMGSEDNEDEAKSASSKEKQAEEAADDSEDDEEPRIEDESGDEEQHGIDQKKAAELLEKLNAKPSAPEDELKSA